MPLFTTPPKPKATNTRHARATLTDGHARRIKRRRSCHGSRPCLLYMSKPRRCSGLLKNCIAEGASSCATVKRLANASKNSGRLSASIEGRLNDANMVMLSRITHGTYEPSVNGLGATVPNARAKTRSLLTARPMLTLETTQNLVQLAVAVLAGAPLWYEVKVST